MQRRGDAREVDCSVFHLLGVLVVPKNKKLERRGNTYHLVAVTKNKQKAKKRDDDHLFLPSKKKQQRKWEARDADGYLIHLACWSPKAKKGAAKEREHQLIFCWFGVNVPFPKTKKLQRIGVAKDVNCLAIWKLCF